jgi:DNA-binding GntR family transcriptional regulator
VVKAIRAEIESGQLQAGDTLPSVRKITKEWGISHATATKVLAALRSEGLAESVQGVGTVVSTVGARHAAKDRVLAIRRTGRIYPPDQHAVIKAAELVLAPAQVADALGLATGSLVIRRHRVTYRGDEAISASVSWFDGELAEIAPLLLEPERIRQGTAGYITEKTGRVSATGRDQNAASAAGAQDSADLGVAEGSPVHRGRNWIYDADGGVIEYGESVSVADRWISYDYEIPG